MAKKSSVFICQECDYHSPSYLGKCPNCGSWNSFVETLLPSKAGSGPMGKSVTLRSLGPSKPPIKLSDIKAEQIERTSTGIGELDRVLGGGIVPGMSVLVSGEPGIGKSTLLLELARNYNKTGQ